MAFPGKAIPTIGDGTIVVSKYSCFKSVRIVTMIFSPALLAEKETNGYLQGKIQGANVLRLACASGGMGAVLGMIPTAEQRAAGSLPTYENDVLYRTILRMRQIPGFYRLAFSEP